MGFAIAVACVTTIFALLGMAGSQHSPINGSAFLDVAAFLAIAFGLSRCSRVAGVSGFLLFLIEKIYGIVQSGNPLSVGIFGVIFLIGFLHGMRGAFAYHKLQSQPAAPVGASPLT